MKKTNATTTPAQPQVSVKLFRSYQKGKLKGFADVELPIVGGGTVVLKGLKLVEGPKGLFVAPSSSKGTEEGKYYDHYFISNEARELVTKAVIEASQKQEAK